MFGAFTVESAGARSAPLSPRSPKGPPPSLTARVQTRLEEGGTVTSIATSENITPALAAIMVEDLMRRGLVTPAESLCASGLGACGGGAGPEVAIHCAGCPLIPLRRKHREL